MVTPRVCRGYRHAPPPAQSCAVGVTTQIYDLLNASLKALYQWLIKRKEEMSVRQYVVRCPNDDDVTRVFNSESELGTIDSPICDCGAIYQIYVIERV